MQDASPSQDQPRQEAVAPDRSTSGETLTFLFSDIEGSTRLEQAVGTAAYGDLRERHRELLRAAFAAHGGDEQGTEGDSFFVAFRTARDAVGAAVEAQRALAAEPWPPGTPIRVRMGLHSGEARDRAGAPAGATPATAQGHSSGSTSTGLRASPRQRTAARCSSRRSPARSRGTRPRA